jgi:hypothetical protein
VSGPDGRAAWHNDMLRDGVVKGLARKAQWQAQQLKAVNECVILFVDEPYLQSYGSATVPLNETETVAALNEVMEGALLGGAIPGIHVCGNTDWGMIARTRTQIINFDAFEYAEAVSLYFREIGDFLERGGALAWGVVPSSSAINSVDLDGLIGILKNGFARLMKKGIRESLLLDRALITPSCGGGSLSLDENRNMLELTAGVSRVLRGES